MRPHRIAAVALMIAGSAVAASAAPSSGTAPAGPFARHAGIETAQAVGARVSARRMQAIEPHVEKVVHALGALSAQDREAALSGAPITRDFIENVRATVRDLDKAAQFNRIPRDVLEALLIDGAEREFSGAVPVALQDGQGRLDAARLLDGVVGATRRQKNAIDTDYLAAINGEGARTVVGGSRVEAAMVTAAATAEDPEVEIDPFETRMEYIDGERWITVLVGDTLGSLALAAYGDSLEYQRLYVANRDRLTTPNTIAPGQRLRLPE